MAVQQVVRSWRAVREHDRLARRAGVGLVGQRRSHRPAEGPIPGAAPGGRRRGPGRRAAQPAAEPAGGPTASRRPGPGSPRAAAPAAPTHATDQVSHRTAPGGEAPPECGEGPPHSPHRRRLSLQRHRSCDTARPVLAIGFLAGRTTSESDPTVRAHSVTVGSPERGYPRVGGDTFVRTGESWLRHNHLESALKPESPQHFDLGVDRLASSTEMQEMRDPWSPTDATTPEPRAPHGIPLPADDLEPWASSLELPGMDFPKP